MLRRKTQTCKSTLGMTMTFFMYMSIYLHMSVYHMPAWDPERPEEGIRFPGTGVRVLLTNEPSP